MHCPTEPRAIVVTRDLSEVNLAIGFHAPPLRDEDTAALDVLAIVLGPLAEPALRQSLLISSGDVMIFLNRPYAGPIMVTAIFLLLLPALKPIMRRIRKKA